MMASLLVTGMPFVAACGDDDDDEGNNGQNSQEPQSFDSRTFVNFLGTEYREALYDLRKGLSVRKYSSVMRQPQQNHRILLIPRW